MSYGKIDDGVIEILPDLPFDLQEGRSLPAPLGKTDVPIAVLPDLACDLRGPLSSFSTEDLSRACRIFMDLAYPDGASAIPENKQAYYSIGADRPLHDFVPPAKAALCVCQEIPRRPGAPTGYAFRLGSAVYPHLKLCVQPIPFHDRAVWVYSVDTHDGGPRLASLLSDDDAKAWRCIVDQNRELKQEIESALGVAGFITPNNLLQLDLAAPASPV